MINQKETTQEQTKEIDKIKTLQDVWNYINKHKWFISNSETQKAKVKYYNKVFCKIYEDLNLLYDKGVLK